MKLDDAASRGYDPTPLRCGGRPGGMREQSVGAFFVGVGVHGCSSFATRSVDPCWVLASFGFGTKMGVFH